MIVTGCLLGAIMCVGTVVEGQSKHWQNNDRELHYTEDQGDFLLVNGAYRFNRALYGDNRASRVEAGDLPEFALYMPGMGGNLQFALQRKGSIKKLIHAQGIQTRYRAGSMIYRIEDPYLGKGHLDIVVLAQATAEGMVVRIEATDIPAETSLIALFGGASGTRFSRNGDIGADPESGFYLLGEYCRNNTYTVQENLFDLVYLGRKNAKQFLQGSFTGTQELRLADATRWETQGKLKDDPASATPLVYARYENFKNPIYIQIAIPQEDQSRVDEARIFADAQTKREQLASRVILHTPDRFINNLGATMAVAADGIWENPTYLHGAVAWRMRLNAWRGAYVADALGWHDRAKVHFSSYTNSQVLHPKTGPVVMDTALHLARHMEEMGTSMFSSGYISRHPNNNTVAHHYDMNLVFFDQIFTHFDHTGDRAYLKEIWPSIVRHLAWERRNFDRDGDGLYDAYCAIWASDGLQYSGGGVSHTSAYNFRANTAAAKLAHILGQDATVYEQEAQKIANALKNILWMSDKGHFAEFQDLLGNKLLHDKPGIWTIYHAADANLLDAFENYQNLQYVQNELPKIPISVRGQQHHGLYTLATTNWQPYTWSINNVSLAENLQASLAYWQAGRPEDAYHLWKSNIIESMYHGISPGNFQQLSHYDAFRGELYRDFADPIGVASRTLVEGLFGVRPKLMDGTIHIRPGFPDDWQYAQISLPEWSYDYKKEQNALTYTLRTNYDRPVKLAMEIPVNFSSITSVTVNGKEVTWHRKAKSIGRPYVVLEAAQSKEFNVQVVGRGKLSISPDSVLEHAYSAPMVLDLPQGQHTLAIYDPQQLIKEHHGTSIRFKNKARKGTFFVQVEQDDMSWWKPYNVALVAPVTHRFEKQENQLDLIITNIGESSLSGQITAAGFHKDIKLRANADEKLVIPISELSNGTNRFTFTFGQTAWEVDYVDWELTQGESFSTQDLSSFYNARLNQIFTQQYLSPRPQGPTLQLPWQGIGNWCYPLTTASIDDSGIMGARKDNQLTYLGVPFEIKGDNANVIFTSQWDNYPSSTRIPLSGSARKAYLLVAGSTNPMQSQLVNAQVEVRYKDGTTELLDLKNPENWWPIEQDFLDDNYAFEVDNQRIPYRIALKTGELFKGGQYKNYGEIKGYSTRSIDGGAASLLDLPLNQTKQLESLTLKARVNDVIVGLIATTLLRP